MSPIDLQVARMQKPDPPEKLVLEAHDLRHQLLRNSEGLSSGYWHLQVSPLSDPTSIHHWYLVLAQGRIIFTGNQELSWGPFISALQRFLPKLRTATAQAKLQRLQQDTPAVKGSMLGLLEKSDLVNLDEVVQALRIQILCSFDQFLFDHRGIGTYNIAPELVTSAPIRGFELAALMNEATRRRQQWLQLRYLVPSMQTIPRVQDNAKSVLSPAQWQQLSGMTRSAKSLDLIARDLGRDPIDVARLFGSLIKSGAVVLEMAEAPASEQPTQVPTIPSAPALQPAKPVDKPTILAVDDSDVMQQLIRRVMGENYHLLVAGSAIEAFGILDQKDISLLLLDVAMPGIDGLELCRSIRAISKFRTLPIIMVTARDGFFDKVKGRVAGATDYLTKPFESEQLLRVVRQHLDARIAKS